MVISETPEQVFEAVVQCPVTRGKEEFRVRGGEIKKEKIKQEK